MAGFDAALGQPPTGAVSADPAMMDQGETPTPEEQQQYETFVSMAILAIYDEKMMPETVKFLKESDDPIQAVASVASGIAMRVFANSQENGAEISGDVILHGGKEIVETVIDLAERVRVAEFTPEMMEKTFYAAADMFAKELSEAGIYTDEAKASDVQALTQMRDSGQIAKMIGGQTPPAPMPSAPMPAPAAM